MARAENPPPQADGAHPKILLTESEAAESIGLTPRFLQERRRRGDGPPYVRLSRRCIRYEPHVLKAWAAAHRRTSTTDPDPSDLGQSGRTG